MHREFDAVIVGAGFAGLYMLHRLRTLGYRAVVCEAGDGVGGTWYWNRYPGARCDAESIHYSYSFDSGLEQEWTWTERYPSQPEILRYLEHVADRFDLRRDIRLGTRVTAAHYDEEANRWTVTAEHGEAFVARFCIAAAGCLSAQRTPEIPGDFGGATYHTGAWPHEPVDFRGKRVGVVGTGSSAVQCMPLIAQDAARTFVFQRTPAFSVPANNRALSDDEVRAVKANYPDLRARSRRSPICQAVDFGGQRVEDLSPGERTATFERAWETGGSAFLMCFGDLQTNQASNDVAADFVRGKIRESVCDPTVAAALTPRGFPIGAKRITVNTGYYQAFNREDVTLVDIAADPIATFTADALRTRGGASYELDAVVFATGFDAMTGALLAIDIRGRDGVALRDEWAAGPRTFLGLGVAGFPNLFTITGPGSPSVLSNVVCSIEQHVEWIADYACHLDAHSIAATEPTRAAQDGWVEHVNWAASQTLMLKAASWYLGANVPGKPRVFMPYVGGAGTYRKICDKVAAAGYEGFAHCVRARPPPPTAAPR